MPAAGFQPALGNAPIFNNLPWVFDCARVLQDLLFAQRNQPHPEVNRPTWTSAAGLESCPTIVNS